MVVASLQVAAGVGTAAQVLVAQRVLAVLIHERGNLTLGAALPSVVLLGLVTVFVRLAAMVASEESRLMGGLVERIAVREVADAASSVALIDYERPAYHNLLQRAQLSATTRPVQMVNSLTASLGAIAGIVGIGIALISIAPILLLLLAIGAIPAWLSARSATRALYRFTAAQTERDRQRSYLFLLLTHKSSATELRAFSLVRFLRNRLDAVYEKRLSDMATLVNRRIVIGAIGSGLSALGIVASMLLLVWLVTQGKLSLAAAGAAAGAVVLLGERLHGLANGSGSLYESSLYMEDFTKFIRQWPPQVSDRNPGPALPGFSLLQASDIQFTYPSGVSPALDGVSIKIRGGQVVALVGENGSGKTTLAKILAGLYQPDRGTVQWDGSDTAEVDAERMHRSVAAIFQDYGKYLMTAADNIGMGDIDRVSDLSAIARAARQAGAEGFIEALPNGFNNLLGSEYYGGADISLGQWQRIALARAFFRDAPFIILDEPTASLDPRAEAAVFDSVRSLFAGRSVLLISHRFGSSRFADRIYVLDAGRVIEDGTHDQLMQAGGRYAELFRLQAASYHLGVLSPDPAQDPA